MLKTSMQFNPGENFILFKLNNCSKFFVNNLSYNWSLGSILKLVRYFYCGFKQDMCNEDERTSKVVNVAIKIKQKKEFWCSNLHHYFLSKINSTYCTIKLI